MIGTGATNEFDEMKKESMTKLRWTPFSANVKWLKRIVLSKEESHSHWQRNDYKGFNPNVDWDTVDFTKSPAVQSMPITSVICESKVDKAKGQIELKGYAWAGGGNRVIRIDLTTDEGQNWCEGKFETHSVQISVFFCPSDFT